MPRSTSLKNYFELLPRDLTGDYIRQVLCSQSKGAGGNEVFPTFISQKWMVCWSAPTPTAEWNRLNAEFHFAVAADSDQQTIHIS